jgi:hypothetical protein
LNENWHFSSSSGKISLNSYFTYLKQDKDIPKQKMPLSCSPNWNPWLHGWMQNEHFFSSPEQKPI